MMSSSSSTFMPLRAAVAVRGPRTAANTAASATADTSERGGAGAVVRSAFPVPIPTQSEPAAPLHFVPLVDNGEDPTAIIATRDQARAAGFAAGFAAGAREAARSAAVEAQTNRKLLAQAETIRSAEHDQAMEALAAAARSLRNRQEPVLDDAEQQLFAAAVDLAEAILGVELSDAETSARAALHRVMTVHDGGQITIRMNPRDAEVIATAPDLVRIVPDAALAHGDAVADHPDGEIDARIGNALQRARTVLAEMAGKES